MAPSTDDRDRVVRLLAGLHCYERWERDQTISALKTMDDQTVIEILTDLIHGPDADLRCDAAEALLRIERQDAIDVVLVLLNDPDSSVRWTVCGLLHDFGNSRTIPAITNLLLNDPEGDIRHIAAYALCEVGDATALAALRLAVQSDDGTDHDGRPTREMAEEAIQAVLARS